MNINKLGVGASSIDTSAKSRNNLAAAKNDGEAGSAVNFNDQVKLSASSKSIQQIEAEVRDLPDVDDSTVERIRNAINNGEYKVDYQQLAGKMLDFEERLN